MLTIIPEAWSLDWFNGFRLVRAREGLYVILAGETISIQAMEEAG